MPIIDLFSKRKKLREGEMPDVYQYDDIPDAFRVQITQIWEEIFAKAIDTYDTYFEIVKILRKEYGVYNLLPNKRGGGDKYNAPEELVNFFITTKNNDTALDVIELTLRYIDVIVRNYNFAQDSSSTRWATQAIEEFNQRAKGHGVGYQYVDGELIRVDSELVHSSAVVPALTVMREKRFANAQSEFLAAHEHYRHGRMTEALVDALKSFESTMKVICDARGWPYDHTKGAAELVRACFDNGLIPAYWQTHFSGLRSVLTSGIPTPRNRQGGHGAGSQPAQTPPNELVSYVLHMTASTILYLSEADRNIP